MKHMKSLAGALCAAGLLGLAAPAQSAILVDNWVIDLDAVGNQPDGNFTGFGQFGYHFPSMLKGLDQMQFQALFRSKTRDMDNDGFVSIGDLVDVDTVGLITGANNANGSVLLTTTNKILNINFELTFGSTTTSKVTSNPPGVQTNTHLGPGTGPNGVAPNGYLNLYADVLGDGIGAQANTNIYAGGAGMLDGVLIAVFEIVDADGADTGSFNLDPLALDGQDDATFVLVSNPFGALKDKFGTALPVGSTLGFTDSNFDADPDNNQKLDTSPANLPGGACPSNNPFHTCGQEDGSVVLGKVPEPGILGLLGLGLLGLGLARRRG